MALEIPVSLHLTSRNKYLCVLEISNKNLHVCSYFSFWFQESVKYLKHILFA